MKISTSRFWELYRPIMERGGCVMAGRYAGAKVDVRTSRDCTTGNCHTSTVLHHVIRPGTSQSRDVVRITERIDPAKDTGEPFTPWTKGRWYLFEIAWLTDDGNQKRAGFANKEVHALEHTSEGGSAAEPRPAL